MKGQILDVKISSLRPFEGHPYKVQDNADMEELVESIRENGVLTPIIARYKDNARGEYEIISGHRRVAACKKLGITEIPARVTFMERDEAIIALVDSNLHRDHILPSEKAHAYKLKMEAMKRQGRRTDLTSTQPVSKLRTDEIVGQSADASRETVRRYIRLTHLIPELLQYVDEEKISFTPAVELSYLPETIQREILEQMQLNDCTPSLSQACKLRKAYQSGTLSVSFIGKLMSEEKANQKPMFRMPMEKLRKFFPRDYSQAQIENEILRLCEARFRRRHDREAR